MKWVSPCLSFFFSASTVAAYIFTAPTCKAIISLEPCALNADFQHFIPRFNKICLLWWIPQKKGFGWKEAQRQGDFTINFSIYTYTPQNIFTGPCKCISPIFTLASGECKNIYTLQQDKCKCKFFWSVSVNHKCFTLTLDLHTVYMAIDTYTHNTGVYNEDTKIWQLSDKIMHVVGGRCWCR